MAFNLETLISTIQWQGPAVDVSAEIIAAVVKLIRSGNFEIYVSEDMPREIILPGWKQRGEINDTQNGPVQGYAGLLKELARSTEDSISIVSVKDAESWFEVFLTPSYEGLIGILHYPIQAIKELTEKRHAQRVNPPL